MLGLDFKRMITKNTELFFKENITPEIRFGTVWEAYKATCHGWIISYSSYKKKEANYRMENLNDVLKDLENKHKKSPENEELYKELVKVKLELNTLINEKLKFTRYQLKTKNYGMGEKAGKILDGRLQKQKKLSNYSSCKMQPNHYNRPYRYQQNV